ncbi:histidine kinase [[Leptolyngbya] sp. PCC 7376]|uniref:ATP-binding protein n=1 Tax=[Leptolyngbya] sp. PCC 7376 TaxID=111781 RepID=UPI00029F1C85|nr:ATP-binding protein [[Leptolyngbya] sp. PCC 7376]AFY37614.1 histidine kinase [[Leptolyngbya] sp. PCC 7376]
MFALSQLKIPLLYPLHDPRADMLKPRLSLLVNLAVASIYHAYSGELEQMRETNAAVINISGRQRMLSQKVALYSMRLVVAPPELQEELRQQLSEILDLMAKSHQGLLHGDTHLKLACSQSAEISKIYYQSPYQLDQQVCDYIEAGRMLLACSTSELTTENVYLQRILNAASEPLLSALDAAVSQYQKEKENADFAIDIYQAQLYQSSLDAQAIAEERAQELKRTVKKLKSTQKQLVQSEKLSTLGYLSAGLAHEINNPLNFIYGNIAHAKEHVEDLMAFLDVLKTIELDPKITAVSETLELDYLRQDLPQVMESMLHGSERIRDLVIDLQKLARQDPDKKVFSDLHATLDSSLVILQHRLHEQQPIQVIKRYDAALQKIPCHTSQINQVFLNILNNAIDAIHKTERTGQITISTQLIASQSRPAFVRVTVGDNGMGITQETMQHMFEPFFTTKMPGDGTGLGLSISRQIIVDSHQGDLRCLSQPNEGAHIIVDLPVNV